MTRSTFRPTRSLLGMLILAGAASAVEPAAPSQPLNTQAMVIPLTAPARTVGQITLPPGFQATLFAAEPDVKQPIGITTDERGRLWIAECDTYAESKVGYDLDQHDRIVVLEDRDQDGHFDDRRVFWDRGQRLTSVEVGFGGVWALCAPHLLFIPDRDGDLVPDGEPEVVLDGWAIEGNHHTLVNGLKWGPDGWLYGRQGIQGTSIVGPPGTPASRRGSLNCGVWRYHPTRKVFEVVSRGGTNYWGFDYDDHGQMFAINTVIGHLWHIVPGAYYERMYGAHSYPHAYGLIAQTADHFHWDTAEKWSDIRNGVTDATAKLGGGHAHAGLMIYLGDNWPDACRGRAYTVNLHGHRVNCEHLARRGCGYVGTHGEDFLLSADPWFRALEMVYGPDGGVYLADWSDIGECHENDGVHRGSGRLYKITYGDVKKTGPVDLRALSDKELVALQLHQNDWYVRQSRRLLQERASEGRDLEFARVALSEMFMDHPDVTRRLRALWGMYVIGAAREDWLRTQLDDPEEHVRVWAVRLLVDGPSVSSETASALARRAEVEPSGLVRVFLASALQRLHPSARWPIAEALAQHGEDRADLELPLVLWYGIEPALTLDPARAVALADQTQIPLLRRYIARRLTGELDRDRAVVDRIVRLLGEDRSVTHQTEILEGMIAALEGWQRAPAPPSWESVAGRLNDGSDEKVRALARELGVVFGDGRSAERLLTIAQNEDADPGARREALRVLIEAKTDDLGPLLVKLMSDRFLVNDAVKGLGVIDSPGAAERILQQYARLDPPGRVQAIDTFASRPAHARILISALARGRIPARDISAAQARQLVSLGDPAIESALKQHWGEVRTTPDEKIRQMADLKAKLPPASIAQADRSRGREIYQRQCASCHTLFGEGGAIGPDLTGGGRSNVDYLLENLVDPGALVAADFKTSIVQLADGGVVTGVVLGRNDRTVTVQTPTERLSLARENVEEIKAQDASLMPDGLLTGLTDEQVRDLVGYLSGPGQVSLP